MTFYEYLNKKRVQCAEGLLYSTDMNITDVAMNSGFSSISAFDRTFKALNQCAPSDFRNTVRAGKDIIVGEMAEWKENSFCLHRMQRCLLFLH